MADFKIISAPVGIKFECPFCETEVEIPWRDVDAPSYWGDEWPDIICPECGQEVTLGEWIYD